MTNRLKYSGLIIGLIMVFLSFLFFGRRQNDYLILLLTGLLFSSVFYLAILLGRHSKKTKAMWTAVIAAAVIVQWQTEPLLFDSSCKIFIADGAFDAHSPGVNIMLHDKVSGIYIFQDTIIDPSKTLSNNDKYILYYKFGKLNGVRVVSKETNYIYYGFKGSRHGIIYWTSTSMPDSAYRPLGDNWYR